jgi:branched-chain amino acid transport system permease protein
MQQATTTEPSVDRVSPVDTRRSGASLAWIGKAFLLIVAALVVFVIVTNAFENPILFIQIVLGGLQLGFVYALIALGYTMVYGIVRLINFAHGDVFMVGAFVSYYAVARFGLAAWPARVFPGLPPWLSVLIGTLTVMLLAMTVSMLLAVTIERVAYKPLRESPRIAALITAIGVSFFLEFFGALYFVFTPRFIPYERPFEVVTWYIKDGIYKLEAGQAPPDGAITISNIFLIIMFTSIAVQILLQLLVRKTKIGKAMRASSFDKATARLMGINVDMVISATFAIGAALAGLGGVLYSVAYPSINSQMGILPGLKAFVAAVLGGIGSIPGAFVGALIMGQAEALTMAYISTPMRDAIAFTVLIIVLLIRPTGIFGEPTGEKA